MIRKTNQGMKSVGDDNSESDIGDDDLMASIDELFDAVINKKPIKGMQFLGAIVSADVENQGVIRHGIPTRKSIGRKTRLPKKVALSKSIAAHLMGRECVYKDKSYVGPVVVDFASASYRWIQISCVTRPWRSGEQVRKFTLVTPVNGILATRFCIHVSGGYGVGGVFIHEPIAVDAIKKLYRSGADGQAVISAINHTKGLPDEVAMLDDLPFEIPARRLINQINPNWA